MVHGTVAWWCVAAQAMDKGKRDTEQRLRRQAERKGRAR